MCAPVGAAGFQSHVHASPVCGPARFLLFKRFYLLLLVLFLMCSCVCWRFASGGELGFFFSLCFLLFVLRYVPCTCEAVWVVGDGRTWDCSVPVQLRRFTLLRKNFCCLWLVLGFGLACEESKPSRGLEEITLSWVVGWLLFSKEFLGPCLSVCRFLSFFPSCILLSPSCCVKKNLLSSPSTIPGTR